MTLKKRFKKQLDTATPNLNRPFYQAEKCEQIAEQFAIEFAEWCNSEEAEDLILDLILVGELDKKPTTKQLLEQFKKEKGL